MCHNLESSSAAETSIHEFKMDDHQVAAPSQVAPPESSRKQWKMQHLPPQRLSWFFFLNSASGFPITTKARFLRFTQPVLFKVVFDAWNMIKCVVSVVEFLPWYDNSSKCSSSFHAELGQFSLLRPPSTHAPRHLKEESKKRAKASPRKSLVKLPRSSITM